ncbi:unnamed protein product [Paramecium octaurelia]|uniref:Protein yippee-like n=1 Tax=Paramecium octaurelia TaxID=43137 RepID=A0A8S1VNC0_PAROT|nr:unnamed protein product [Paramecium octaurelia]
MGKIIIEYLEGKKIYACKNCNVHLSSQDYLTSKQFTGKSGTAFLFEKGVNYLTGIPEDKRLRTGLHTTQDIMCIKCQTYLGWKYLHAYEQSEKYKEGKIILEKLFLTKIKWN